MTPDEVCDRILQRCDIDVAAQAERRGDVFPADGLAFPIRLRTSVPSLMGSTL